MTVYQQFFGSLLGSLLGLGLMLLFSKRARKHVVAYCCLALGLSFTIPVWRWTLEGSRYDILFLPFVAAVVGAASCIVGFMVEAWLRKGAKSD